MRFSIRLLALLAVALICDQLNAEKAPSSAAKLLNESTHVVTGIVKAIYQRTESIDDWEYRYFVAEIRVKEIEKGVGIAADSLIYARYWKKQWRGKGAPPPDTSGHFPIPNKDDAVRVYLARNSYDGFTVANNDGGFNVIGSNGFEKLLSKLGK